MAIQLLLQSTQVSTGSPITKLILIQLASKADQRGACYPSHHCLARECDISIRTVQRHLTILFEMGILTKTNRFDKQGVQSSNLYQLNLERYIKPNSSVSESHEEALKTTHKDDRVTDIISTSNKNNNKYTELNHILGHSDTVVTTLSSLDGEVGVGRDFVESLEQEYPTIDILHELESIRQWLMLHPEKRKSAKSIRYFVNHWLYRAHRAQGSQTKPTPPVRNQRSDAHKAPSSAYTANQRAKPKPKAVPKSISDICREEYIKKPTKHPIEARIAAIVKAGRGSKVS
ncbi:helix-turn-helix domain-containing protein [Vibrio agarivorans]|uniref:helix-turn-helix domain-containing protein n=1 Tax=Vibrio agarivorans TaxID=153622 RepID=UPI0025B38C20|nr:helix-turn-helix domain-containing protein [Vibrio agarivorans]MDN3660365.1 helix-turn-helix domain-containing protein [Vibrio agarivorans]